MQRRTYTLGFRRCVQPWDEASLEQPWDAPNPSHVMGRGKNNNRIILATRVELPVVGLRLIIPSDVAPHLVIDHFRVGTRSVWKAHDPVRASLFTEKAPTEADIKEQRELFEGTELPVCLLGQTIGLTLENRGPSLVEVFPTLLCRLATLEEVEQRLALLCTDAP